MEQLAPPNTVNTQQNINQAANGTTVQMDAPVAPPTPTTKTIDIDNIAPETNKFKVNLFQSDINTDFLKAKTPDAKPDADTSNINYINPGAQSSASSSGSSGISQGPLIKTRESLRAGIKAALMVVDYIISFAAMKISGDTRPNAHTPDAAQKRLLEDVLVEYLYNKQTEMPMWLTLTFAIAGSYGIILASAAKTRYDINKNKKQNDTQPQPQKPIITPPPQTRPVNQTISAEQMKSYQNIKPPVTPPPVQNQRLHTETVYREVNGVMEPTQEPTTKQSYSEILNKPVNQSSPANPDPNIVADTPEELRNYVSKGIYPMFRKNGKGRPLKVQYDLNGMPKIPGKPAKAVKGRYAK